MIQELLVLKLKNCYKMILKMCILNVLRIDAFIIFILN